MQETFLNYVIVKPEVIVGMGENTTGSDIHNQNGIDSLHINLEDWLGDDLVEVFPCFLVTQSLFEELTKQQFSGFEIDYVEVTKDDYFENNYQLEKPLPTFYWLIINGKKGKDDFFIDENLNLNISLRVLNLLKRNFSINYLETNPVRNETDDFLDRLFNE